jgi:uncharacterized protein YndB with AHSA1/START domain/quercetin dioxygenase-like cupin family protein
MVAIIRELIIEVTPECVWRALTQVDEIGHWWTNDLNFTAEVGFLAEFRFGEWGDFVLRFEIAELDEGSKMQWLSRRSPVGQWTGTSVTWQLEPIQNGTKLVFTHDGFTGVDEVYEQTRGNWDYFLASLKSYLETGKGSPGLPPYLKVGDLPVNPIKATSISSQSEDFQLMATSTISHKEQEVLWYLGTLRIIEAVRDQTGHAVHLTEYVLPAGRHIYAHLHKNGDEGIYVVEGEATFSCGQKVMSAIAGTLLFLPRNVQHHLEVSKSAPFRYLTWMTEAGFAQHVLHLGEPGEALVLSPPPLASEEKIQQLALQFRNATTTSLEDFSRLS